MLVYLNIKMASTISRPYEGNALDCLPELTELISKWRLGALSAEKVGNMLPKNAILLYFGMIALCQ